MSGCTASSGAVSADRPRALLVVVVSADLTGEAYAECSGVPVTACALPGESASLAEVPYGSLLSVLWERPGHRIRGRQAGRAAGKDAASGFARQGESKTCTNAVFPGVAPDGATVGGDDVLA